MDSKGASLLCYNKFRTSNFDKFLQSYCHILLWEWKLTCGSSFLHILCFIFIFLRLLFLLILLFPLPQIITIDPWPSLSLILPEVSSCYQMLGFWLSLDNNNKIQQQNEWKWNPKLMNGRNKFDWIKINNVHDAFRWCR